MMESALTLSAIMNLPNVLEDVKDIIEGEWTLEGNLAVFRKYPDGPNRCTRESLEDAIQNVRGEIRLYVSNAAYTASLAHFQRGLALFQTPPTDL